MINATLAVLLSLAIYAFEVTTAQAQTASHTQNRIMQILSRLPVSAFDHTTEGIEAGEYATLLSRRMSDNWRIKSITPSKVIFAAKVPFSEIHVSFKLSDGQEFLETLTFNERVVHYSYWIAQDKGKPLSPYIPRAIFRVFNEAAEGGRPLSRRGVPPEISNYIELLEGCQKPPTIQDTDAAAAVGKARAGRATTLNCAAQKELGVAVRAKFGDQPRWRTVLDTAERILID